MANTFAPTEQSSEKIDHKVTQHSDGGAVSAAQAAYQPGTKMEFKAHKQNDGTLEFTPIYKDQTEPANKNAMRGSELQKTAPDEDVKPALKVRPLLDHVPQRNEMQGYESADHPGASGAAGKSGSEFSEPLGKQPRKVPVNEAQPNSNAMRGTEIPETSGKTGWEPYESLNLGIRKAPAAEAIPKIYDRSGSKTESLPNSKPGIDTKSAPLSNNNLMEGQTGPAKKEKSGWEAYEALDLGIRKAPTALDAMK